MAPSSRYDYINQDLPGDDILAVLIELPKRWGRMDKISRLAVVEVGRVLAAYGLLARGGFKIDMEWKHGHLTKAKIESLHGSKPLKIRVAGEMVNINKDPRFSVVGKY